MWSCTMYGTKDKKSRTIWRRKMIGSLSFGVTICRLVNVELNIHLSFSRFSNLRVAKRDITITRTISKNISLETRFVELFEWLTITSQSLPCVSANRGILDRLRIVYYQKVKEDCPFMAPNHFRISSFLNSIFWSETNVDVHRNKNFAWIEAPSCYLSVMLRLFLDWTISSKPLTYDWILYHTFSGSSFWLSREPKKIQLKWLRGTRIFSAWKIFWQALFQNIVYIT